MQQLTKEDPDSIIYIGEKDKRDYVLSVIRQSKRFKRLIICARGNHITKAVDISQIALNNYLEGWSATSDIGTEPRDPDPKRAKNPERKDRVSYIIITLRRGPK